MSTALSSSEYRRTSTVERGPRPGTGMNVLDPSYAQATEPSESNTTHAGINVATGLANANFGIDAATEAFDEPLDRADVVAIVQPFFIPTVA